MEQNEQIYTVEDIAAKFKVKNRTVYQWIYRGELISFKIGNNVRITEASLQLFIEDSNKALKAERK